MHFPTEISGRLSIQLGITGSTPSINPLKQWLKADFFKVGAYKAMAWSIGDITAVNENTIQYDYCGKLVA